jgi:hypothetical protein
VLTRCCRPFYIPASPGAYDAEGALLPLHPNSGGCVVHARPPLLGHRGQHRSGRPRNDSRYISRRMAELREEGMLRWSRRYSMSRRFPLPPRVPPGPRSRRARCAEPPSPPGGSDRSDLNSTTPVVTLLQPALDAHEVGAVGRRLRGQPRVMLGELPRALDRPDKVLLAPLPLGARQEKAKPCQGGAVLGAGPGRRVAQHRGQRLLEVVVVRPQLDGAAPAAFAAPGLFQRCTRR